MSRIVSPTRESLKMAIELSLNDKIPHGQLIPTAALLDGYLSGIVAVDLSFDEKGRPVVQIKEGQQPESADDARHWSDCAVHNEPAYPAGPCDCGGYSPRKSPPDEKFSGLNVQVNAGEVYSQIGAKLLLESLSPEELTALQRRELPSDLAALLSGLASEEDRRRRGA